MTNFDKTVDRRGTGSLKWDKYQEHDVLPLWVADMDFESAPEITAALRARADHGVFGYTVPYHEVTHAVLDYLRSRHGIAAQADWIVWLPGLVQGLNLACRAFGNAGDAVITATPVYPPFLSAPGFSDRKRITVPLRLDGDTWNMDFEALEKAVTPETKLFNLCSPHNPVGRVWRREELEKILGFCERHDLILCSDEIHCDLILDDVPFVPTLSLGERAAKRTIALYSPSKTYNLPGLACAYAVIPDTEVRTKFKRVCRGLVTEINVFGYIGCLNAYRHGEPWRRELIAYLRANRNLVYRFAAENFPELKITPMEATYLAWFDVRALGLENPHKFFEGHGVGLSNGLDFGAPGFLRLNFGCTRSLLQTGLDRMKFAVETWRKQSGRPPGS
jgi:cystathionine beta-lyase